MSDDPSSVARLERARMIYILADMVSCGCAEVSIETETGGITRQMNVRIVGRVHGCIHRDHAKDWPVRT